MLDTKTTASDYAKFVAAARWAKANGWRYDRTDFFGMREFRWRKERLSVSLIDGRVDVRDASADMVHAFPAEVQQGIDYLVVAGLLPTRFASWAAVQS